MRFQHLGVPTDMPRKGEYHLPEAGVYVLDYRSNPYGIEWMRYEPHCILPEIIQTVPHLAFVVPDLDAAIDGKKIIIQPNSPSEGVRVAFIVEHGAPIELMEVADEVAHLFPCPGVTED
ncbi:MAG: hypothetical protein JRD68_02940 [Deltaproteobacteria bacterium]|nr:hypothetical protein [Deltaproteobacteria bacterium]